MSDSLYWCEVADVQMRQREGEAANGMGCLGCMGATEPEGGHVIMPSPDLYKPISSYTSTRPTEDARKNHDHPLQKSARAAANSIYNLRPQGGESVQSLLTRIGEIYYDHRKRSWSGAVNAGKVMDDPDFHQVVALISPMSTMIKPGEITDQAALKSGEGLDFKYGDKTVKPDDYKKPTPGATPVKYNSFQQALEAIKAGLTSFTELQKQQAALEAMQRQQQGLPNYLPEKAKENLDKKAEGKTIWPWDGWGTSTKIAAGIGIVLVGGVTIYAIMGPRRPKARRQTTMALAAR